MFPMMNRVSSGTRAVLCGADEDLRNGSHGGVSSGAARGCTCHAAHERSLPLGPMSADGGPAARGF